MSAAATGRTAPLHLLACDDDYHGQQLYRAEEEIYSAVFEMALYADRCPDLPRQALAMVEVLRRISRTAIEALCSGIHELALLTDISPAMPQTFLRMVETLRDRRQAVFEAQHAMPKHGPVVVDEMEDDDWGDEAYDGPVDARRLDPIWKGDMEKAPRDGRTVWATFRPCLTGDARRPDLAAWSDKQVPIVHVGMDAAGADLGWALAIPIPAGAFPSNCFSAWRWPSHSPLSPPSQNVSASEENGA